MITLLRRLGAVLYVKTNQPQTIMHLECHSVYGRTVSAGLETYTCLVSPTTAQPSQYGLDTRGFLWGRVVFDRPGRIMFGRGNVSQKSLPGPIKGPNLISIVTGAEVSEHQPATLAYMGTGPPPRLCPPTVISSSKFRKYSMGYR